MTVGMTMLRIGRLGRPSARMDSCPWLNNNTHTALLDYQSLIDPHLIPADVDGYFAGRVIIYTRHQRFCDRESYRLNSMGHISRAFCPRILLSPLWWSASRFKAQGVCVCVCVCVCVYVSLVFSTPCPVHLVSDRAISSIFFSSIVHVHSAHWDRLVSAHSNIRYLSSTLHEKVTHSSMCWI